MIGFSFGTGGRAGGLGDPASLAMTGLWRNFVNPTWSGTASLGTSGSNTLTDPGNEPAQGTALNGQGTANFNGTNDYFIASGTLDTYFAATAFSGWVLLSPDTVVTDRCILDDDANQFRLTIEGGGSQVGLNINGVQYVTRAITTGGYRWVTFRFDGATAQIGVNELPGAAGGGSSAAAVTSMTLAGNFYIGALSSLSDFFDGHIAEIVLTDFVLNDSQFLAMRTYINQRYALSI